MAITNEDNTITINTSTRVKPGIFLSEIFLIVFYNSPDLNYFPFVIGIPNYYMQHSHVRKLFDAIDLFNDGQSRLLTIFYAFVKTRSMLRKIHCHFNRFHFQEWQRRFLNIDIDLNGNKTSNRNQAQRNENFED